MRPSTSSTMLPEIGRNSGGANRQLRGSTSMAAFRSDPSGAASRLELSASAPSLKLQVGNVREGVERVVAKLTDRPGIAPLLLLHDQEHGAAIFKALRNENRRKAGPTPPRLLTQPPLRKGAVSALQRRSNVLSQVADELGAYRGGEALFDDDDGNQVSTQPLTPPHAYKLLRARSAASTAQPRPTGWLIVLARVLLPQDPANPGSPAGAPASGADGHVPAHLSHLPRGHSQDRVSLPSRGSNRSLRASTPLLMMGASHSTSSLHAARAAAAKSSALLDTRVDAYLREYKLAQQSASAAEAIQVRTLAQISRLLRPCSLTSSHLLSPSVAMMRPWRSRRCGAVGRRASPCTTRWTSAAMSIGWCCARGTTSPPPTSMRASGASRRPTSHGSSSRCADHATHLPPPTPFSLYARCAPTVTRVHPNPRRAARSRQRRTQAGPLAAARHRHVARVRLLAHRPR